jgi:Protein of unknown function (DUF3617)
MRTDSLELTGFGVLSPDQQRQLPFVQQGLRATMAGLPPEQRRQVETLLGGQRQVPSQGAIRIPIVAPNVVRYCISQDMVERNEVPATYARCKHTALSTSGASTRIAVDCAGSPARGEGSFTVIGANSYSLRAAIVSERDGKPELMEFKGRASFVSQTCDYLRR